MNSTNKTIAVLTVALSMMAAAVAINNFSTASAQNVFSAKLSGQEEVPPVQTNATGTATFNPIEERVDFIVNATNVQNVTAGHIHSGDVGENGPIVVTLIESNSSQVEASNNGITEDMLEGPMEGESISDLAAAMNDGNTYVNIHTAQNPNGEIRGQIMSGE